MTNLIAITIGDINGIGIEILIKLWKTNLKSITLFYLQIFFTIFLLRYII